MAYCFRYFYWKGKLTTKVFSKRNKLKNWRKVKEVLEESEEVEGRQEEGYNEH